MYQPLIDAMRDYLDAGVTMDLDRLDARYDDEFENLRVDQAGQVVRLTKEQFMSRFVAMKAQGQAMEPADDATFPATTLFGDFGTVIMRREKNGKPTLYAFTWRMADGKPTTILREFTFDDDLTYLIQIMAAASAAAQK
ncbi:MAG: hypothetical protein HOU81_18565 [Hamadaea sp.]|uniref:hypothetical protein n=1 Tax=Hamadaea sp. TaxID=2024425 RepID=UPI0018247D9B|nr:hypothetical protein [Hamadaea sp.]NUR72821.1 hypothetical protein [Hamadaea sp.]NUT20464.1 hypothetical protein [Hamadaea sp.]